MAVKLTSISIRGFKSINSLEDFRPNPITILIGPNGAGKSNFISFFRLLAYMTATTGNLQMHVGDLGGASKFLFDGPSKTRDITASLTIETSQGRNDYEFRLAFAAGDTFIFADEKFRFSRKGFPSLADWTELGAGHKEAEIVQRADGDEQTPTVIRWLLRKLIVYQFHNTSDTARIKQKWHKEDSKFLKEDAGNISPFLYRLKINKPKHYKKIVDTIRLILPFFSDFEFELEKEFLLLKWREIGTDVVFNASQAADGMLRVIALVSLLLQPEDDLPDVLIFDEPELGLHPFAINIVSGLIKAVSVHRQIIVATQSTSFLDRFDVGNVVVVERKERETTFRNLEEQEFKNWVEEYSLSELWEKNVFGGRPK